MTEDLTRMNYDIDGISKIYQKRNINTIKFFIRCLEKE